jgi:hypothetical protein
MELLLNVIWITLALGVLWAFVSRRRSSVWTARVPYVKALLALAWGLVLLFPIISASDDLHPVQAVVEDTSKRVQQAVATVTLTPNSSSAVMIPMLLALHLLFALVALRRWRPSRAAVRVLDCERIPADGRAPPSFL